MNVHCLMKNFFCRGLVIILFWGVAPFAARLQACLGFLAEPTIKHFLLGKDDSREISKGHLLYTVCQCINASNVWKKLLDKFIIHQN